MSDETLRALLAGFISGAAGAFATTTVLLVMLSRSTVWQRLPENRRIPMPLVGVVFVNLLMLTWTAAGLLLGAVYLRAESERPGGAFLTPNWTFTALVGGLIVVALAAASVVRGRVGRTPPLVATIAIIAFGWMLPGLAG